MDKDLRDHLAELLAGRSAHIYIESALKDFPLDHMNERIEGSPHTAWELLEHIRIAQSDILEFSRDPAHVSPPWPDGYWPKIPGTPDAWRDSVQQIRRDLEAIKGLAADESVDLLDPIKHGDGQTVLREVLLTADHNSYHLGQLVLLRRIFEGR